MLGAKQLVGTDLTQAVPLTAAAALGALAFGHVELGVTTSLIIGSVPAVFIGSLLSSSAPDRYIRPVIMFVVGASGLKYVGVGTTTLGWLLCAALLVTGCVWLVSRRPWQRLGPDALEEPPPALGSRRPLVADLPLIRTEAPEIEQIGIDRSTASTHPLDPPHRGIH
jgi:hypothetical protein